MVLKLVMLAYTKFCGDYWMRERLNMKRRILNFLIIAEVYVVEWRGKG